jgi:hypothetical protein
LESQHLKYHNSQNINCMHMLWHLSRKKMVALMVCLTRNVWRYQREVIRNRNSKKDRQTNDQKKKDKRTNDLHNITQKTKDRTKWTTLKPSGELRCSGRVAVTAPSVAPFGHANLKQNSWNLIPQFVMTYILVFFKDCHILRFSAV